MKISKFISAAYQELLKGALAVEELDHMHEAAKARAAGKCKRWQLWNGGVLGVKESHDFIQQRRLEEVDKEKRKAIREELKTKKLLTQIAYEARAYREIRKAHHSMQQQLWMKVSEAAAAERRLSLWRDSPSRVRWLGKQEAVEVILKAEHPRWQFCMVYVLGLDF